MLNSILLAIVLVALPPGTRLAEGQLNIKAVETFGTMHECQKAARILQEQIDTEKSQAGLKIEAQCFKPVVGVPI